METRECACGWSGPSDAGRYVGAQEVVGGEWLLLHDCPGCGTTYASATVYDAAKCALCSHLILGDAEDPKVILSAKDIEGPYTRVYCADCACTDAIARSARSIDNAVWNIRARLGIDIDARRAERWAAAHPSPRRSRSSAPAPLEMRAP